MPTFVELLEQIRQYYGPDILTRSLRLIAFQSIMISIDMRWRFIVLTYLYDIDVTVVASVMGVSTRSISRWGYLFRRRGTVIPNARIERKTRWPPETIKFVKGFVEEHPCFYIEELQAALKPAFPALPNISTATICRALKSDLGLTRKVLTKRARESVPAEIDAYYKKLAPFYRGPHQLIYLHDGASGRVSSALQFW
ncbi:hypothetical protein ON010_g6392 [Phytophthora cinnamomi]|nr:hypothetical protein ON010_g6392 [Phytophthora cinnamomi]